MSSIIGIKLSDRLEESVQFQEILTKFGCYIKTRIGLHNIGEYKCERTGIILLEIVDKVNDIYDELSRHWEVQIMRF